MPHSEVRTVISSESDASVRCPAIVLAAILIAAPVVAVGQTARSGGDAVARLQAMLQQANTDKTALANENSALKLKLETAEKDLARLRKDSGGLASRAAEAESQARRAEAGRQSSAATLETTQQRLQDVVGKYRELAENTRAVELERNRVNGELTQHQRELESCRSANVELAGIAEEALSRYQEKGVLAALAQKETFTGIQRARIDNLVDSYRAEIESKRIRPAAPPAATPGSTAPP
jgi:chromosome segregation ATPase